MLGPMSPSAPRAGWWARRGVRARSTIVAVVVVGAALIVGAIGLIAVLQVSLTNSIEQSVRQRAQDIAAQIGSDDVDAVSATAGATPGDLTIVQVVGGYDNVLLASPSIDGEAAILPEGVAKEGPVTRELPLPFVDNDRYLVAAVASTTSQGPITAIAAQSVEPIHRVVRTVVLALAAAAPLLLAAVGLVTWAAVGRSLASVDRIRMRVEEIDGGDLTDRVPVPPAKDEIEQLAVMMNHMLDRLEQSMISQRQFVADASHELKSPLASMRASLDVARGTTVDADTERILDEEVDRMTRLVNDLLLLARADEGFVATRRTEVDVDDVVMSEAHRLREQSTLTVDLDVEPARVSADPHQISRAVRNLVDNAIRYATTRVLLGVHVQGARVVVSVDDDGSGIPHDQLGPVFDRFVRLDEDRSRGQGGVGLGLAIVSEIAHAHHGDVWAAVSDLGGAQVGFWLPLDPTVVSSSR